MCELKRIKKFISNNQPFWQFITFLLVFGSFNLLTFLIHSLFVYLNYDPANVYKDCLNSYEFKSFYCYVTSAVFALLFSAVSVLFGIIIFGIGLGFSNIINNCREHWISSEEGNS